MRLERWRWRWRKGNSPTPSLAQPPLHPTYCRILSLPNQPTSQPISQPASQPANKQDDLTVRLFLCGFSRVEGEGEIGEMEVEVEEVEEMGGGGRGGMKHTHVMVDRAERLCRWVFSR